ncbi:replication protein RepA [Aquimonas sp.]|jgi:hypothetical protein|uniref:replication protein RepA n=1 Tax=Aquimonas sp. TaxID=1872588 RepID=UPI0037BF79AD
MFPDSLAIALNTLADPPSLPTRPKRDRASVVIARRSTELANIWTTSARESGSLAYMARVLAQATLPHSEPNGLTYSRTNGNLTLVVTTTSDAGGLPYGSLPRLLLAWITSEVVRTGSREISLGRNVSEFMRDKLGMAMTGGKNGTITRLREQLHRLTHATFKVIYRDAEVHAVSKGWDPIEESATWWQPHANTRQQELFESRLLLGQKFFDEIQKSAVPLDWRVLKHLQKSPLRIDIAIWLPYRLHCLQADVVIPWQALAMQFGAEYKEPRQFKAAFLRALGDVLRLYERARVDVCDTGLRLRPSPALLAAA